MKWMGWIVFWMTLSIVLGLTFQTTWAQAVCQPLPPDEQGPPNEDPPKMGRYTLQGLYLGISSGEVKNILPNISITPVSEEGVLHEYHGELAIGPEQFLFVFTADNRLYKLVYKKKFDAAVVVQDLLDKLTSRYGPPFVSNKAGTARTSLEACWGQCLMIRDNVFCQDENTDRWYTYFTTSLDITRRHFSLVLNDSGLHRRNEQDFIQRKRTRRLAPSTQALEDLKL